MLHKAPSLKTGQILTLILILILGLFLRLVGLNWDQNQHLHPDERFLTMVGLDLKIPDPPLNYFDPSVSTLNPRNMGYDFFVYGTFPLTLNKAVALVQGANTYDLFTLQGRFLSGFADLLTLILIFAFARLLIKPLKLPPSFPLWASLFYALLVLPIQLSHFFAVDTFLSLFMLLSLYLSLRFYFYREPLSLITAGLAMGLAFASKLNALYILPLNLLFLIIPPVLPEKFRFNRRLLISALKSLAPVLIFLLLTYFSLRLADPTIFRSANWFNPLPNPQFIQNIGSLKSFEGEDTWFPPAIQWLSTVPVWHSLKNLALIGLGLPIFVFMLLGIAWWDRRLFKGPVHYRLLLGLLGVWVIGIFVYQSIQFVKALRYFIFLYPFFALFAATGWLKFKGYLSKLSQAKKPFSPLIPLISLLSLILIFIWPAMFLSIYIKDHPRLTASEWIYRQIPAGSLILHEHWDDGLPLGLSNFAGLTYRYEQLPVFEPDTLDKWARMETLLEKADYYVLSSNRAWGSIMKVPEKYPRMSRFYEDLFAGNTNFKKIAEFTSYPSLSYLGIPITFPDDWADETFTVYDHPKVLIFEKTSP